MDGGREREIKRERGEESTVPVQSCQPSTDTLLDC